MLFKQRIIHGDNGVLKDLSVPLNDLFGSDGDFPYVVVEDYLYIGSDLPFTHRYIRMATINAVAAVISEIAIWDGGTWVAAVDIIDQTSVGGKTLAQSGIVSWTTPRNTNWGQESTTENMTSSGIETLKIYDFYWVRIKISATLTAGTKLAYVGHLFSDDDDLSGYYPDLLKTEVLNAFKAAKTDWLDQHCLAAEEIIRYLRKKRIIWSPNQVLNWQQFMLASIHKCAEIIYSAFPGDDFEDLRSRANKKYYEQINQGVFETDRSEDGRVDQAERRPYAGLVRS